MEGGRKRQEAAATSGRRRAKAEQDPGAAERRRVKAEQDGAAERARAWEATLERRRVKAEQEAAAASARAPGRGRRRQAREDPLARATTARDALEAREAREAAADYSRMGAEREAVEERERVRAGRQRAIAEKKAKEEEARRKEEEIRQKEEEARIALQKLERETRELTRRLRQLEMMEKEAKEKLDKEKQEAGGGGGGGGGGEFGPRRWPTREEFQDAMQKTQYDRNKFHIAIVGGTGSGKSSLINAFRNLRNKDPGAARAGMAGTTLEIGRYPEPGTASAGQCIVWYDFPGAGTQRDIPDHDLFVRQGLFVFDLVLLAISDRFAEIDARIVEDCARFQIPVFIVWSKADMHILNLMKEYGDYVRAADNPALYAKCRDEFISQTQRVVSAGLAGCREKLPGHEVYVVSRDVLQRTYNGGGGDLHRVGAQHDAGVIHEGRLSRQLLAAAAGRRCDAGSGGGGPRGEEGGLEGLGTQALRAADGSRGGPAAKRPVTNAGNRARNTAAGGDAEGGLAAGNRNSRGVNARTDIPGPSNPPTAAGVLHSNRQRNPPPPPPPVQPLQPPPPRPPRAQNRTANERKPAQQAAASQKVLKMIYPRQPTDSDELFADLIRSNPDMEHMLVCKPRMFNPKAGMLTFSHLAPVPAEVTAFGVTLRLKDYEVRSRRGAGEKKGEAAAAAAEQDDRRSNLPTCGDGGPESGWAVDSSASERSTRRGEVKNAWRDN